MANPKIQDKITPLPNQNYQPSNPPQLKPPLSNAKPMQTALRTHGVAPLSVMFDATIDQSIISPPTIQNRKVWEQFQYIWNFNDPSSGNWSQSNKSKNSDYGYTASHIYENPGTYNVSLNVITESGIRHSHTQTITVSDPEIIYAGKTFYVANSGNDNNPGTETQPFASFGKAVQFMFSSNGPRRILFKRGDSFTYSTYTTPSSLTGPFHFGAYGSGAKPVIASSTANAIFTCDKTCVDTRFVDLDLQGSGTGQAHRSGSQSLILRNNINNFDAGFSTSDAHGLKSQVFIVENNITNSKRYGIYFNFGSHVAILGNKLETISGPNGEHVARTYITHSNIKYNLFDGGWNAKHQLKFVGYFSSGHQERSSETPTEAVEFTVISNNRFVNSGPIAWMIVLGPVDGGKDQRIENCIFERNYLESSISTQVMLMLNNRWIVARNNIFNGSLTPSNLTCVRTTRRGIEPQPEKHFILNNSFYSSSPGQFRGIQITTGSINMQCINNLMSAINSSSSSVVSNAGINSIQVNNFLSNGAFIDPDNGNFHVVSNNPSINGGTTISEVKEDYNNKLRPLNRPFDIGAIEN